MLLLFYSKNCPDEKFENKQNLSDEANEYESGQTLEMNGSCI